MGSNSYKYQPSFFDVKKMPEMSDFSYTDPNISKALENAGFPKWNPSMDFSTAYNTPITDFSRYWDLKADTAGDTAGDTKDQTTKWNPGKEYLANFLNKGGAGPRYSQQENNKNPSAMFSGGSSGGTTGNLLPNFSFMQPESAKIVGYVAPIAGEESPWAPVASLATGLAGSFLNPVAGAAGGAFGKMLFPK